VWTFTDAMMDDIILVTADSVRRDYAGEMTWLCTHEVKTGITSGNYTRPSLASLLTSNYRSAIESQVVGTTIAEVLSNEGYTCLGYSPTPNTDASFGFDRGFEEYRTFIGSGTVGNRFRQYLSKFDPLRRLYYWLNPPQAKSDNRPSDGKVIDQAIKSFNDAASPRFLWVHLMESHRPYGQGDDAIPNKLDQKAYFSPDKLTSAEKQTIDTVYRNSLSRVDQNIQRLYEEVDVDPTFVFTADHGECFGETGFYYHRGHERSVADELIEVPVVVKGLNITGPVLSLLDIAPTLVSELDISIPEEWHGESVLTSPSEYAITIGPWYNKATLAWQDFERKIVARDAEVQYQDSRGKRSQADRADVDPELTEQLRDLGYVDEG
jgi:arylsulfatase A-like enzyme